MTRCEAQRGSIWPPPACSRSPQGRRTPANSSILNGGELVTFVEGDRGHMTDIRQLSPDGKTLTVTGYHRDELVKPYYIRVMTKIRP